MRHMGNTNGKNTSTDSVDAIFFCVCVGGDSSEVRFPSKIHGIDLIRFTPMLVEDVIEMRVDICVEFIGMLSAC